MLLLCYDKKNDDVYQIKTYFLLTESIVFKILLENVEFKNKKKYCGCDAKFDNVINDGCYFYILKEKQGIVDENGATINVYKFGRANDIDKRLG